MAGDHFTAEAAVRFPPGPDDCNISMAYWGLGVGSPEGRASTIALPPDNRWYVCRVDFEHGGDQGFSTAHNTLRWELYNNSLNGRNVDVDFTHLGFYTNPIAATQGDPAPPPDRGTPCTLEYRYAN